RSMARDNKTIGRFNLDGITPAPRGVPQIEVSFDIDANGILNVSARDKATGKEQKIRIEASSGLSDDEIKRMRDEAKANEAADKAEKERIDKINGADAMIFQSEKNLKEYGDKIPADKKGAIENALGMLKEAHKNQNLTDIERATEALNNAWHAASEDMARAAQQQGPQGGAGDAGYGGTGAGYGGNNAGYGGQQNNGSSDNNGPEDVDYEEVK
ncbi:MAG: Hsp70 family protein, partial [Bacteroidales bacterium]|nr:Hsp70 family protein [Bacteroidales bacterium]